jgi:predicted O-linked N-acetylglucosamine transferase (SPINDLY family)
MTDPADLFYKALEFIDRKEFSSAVATLEDCLKLAPGRASVKYNLASTLCQTGDFKRASDLAENLLHDEPDNPDYQNLLASAIFPLGEVTRAISIYEALRTSGHGSMEINLNLLHALVSTGEERKAEALLAEIKAKDYPASSYRLSLAILRFRQSRFDEALLLLDKVLAENPSDTESLFQRARVRIFQKNIDGAIADFQTLDALGEQSARVRTHAFMARQQAALWDGYHADVAFLAECDENGAPNCSNPFVGLLLPRTLDHEYRISRNAVRDVNDQSAAIQARQPALPRHCSNERIHVGYVSANYRRHPSAHNITRLIELHDRSKFRIIGFDLYGENRSEERTRLKAAFDGFVDLSQKSDEEAGDIIRHLGVDILIDQMGHTARSRSGIFAQRNAPVQISYLGFPGTSGLDSIDYVIADDTVIQPGEDRFYTEAVCYMPDTYWPAEGGVPVGETTIRRQDYGISDTAVAFCCFNIFQKITPTVFTRWMQILAHVPDSQLVLLDGPEIAKNNLRREAEIRGVARDRLIFIPKVSPEEHLARQSLFDLFLDTSPYNAHTIGRDALLGGLPMLTCLGNTFSDRVGASLLRAAGLEELITSDGEEFVRLGVELGRNPDKIQQFKRILCQNRQTHPLFDTPLFARNFECAFREMNRRSMAGERHTSFHVSDTNI